MKVLVCGGRNYNDSQMVKIVLDRVHKRSPIEMVIHGAAAGADTLGGEWAEANNIPVLRFPANWTRDGKAAGPIRNQRMLDEGKPDLVVAFPGNRGTDDMILRTMKAKIPIEQIDGKWKP